MEVSIVIPNYNRCDALLQTLDSLAGVAYPADRWEILVVDDGSRDGAADAARNWAERSPIRTRVFQQANRGPAAARNRGAFAAEGERLLFLDNDVLVQPDLVSAHAAALDANPGCWIVGRVIQSPRLRETPFGRFRDDIHERFHQEYAADVPTETPWITTQNLSLPSADFRALGGFDEQFTIASGEDWELGLRARKSGLRLLYEPSIAVVHNDWAGSLSSFCERQRMYSLSDVLLWRKYPIECPRTRLVLENGPIDWSKDGFRTVARKAAKHALSAGAGRAAIRLACGAAERVAPDSRVSHRLYYAAISGAIYRGVRQGLLQYDGPPRLDTAVDLPSAASDSPAGAAASPQCPPLRSASVVIPTFNRCDVLQQTLNALARIDLPREDWELIVVDDGSTDGTEALVRRWIEQTSIRATYLRQQNRGPAVARNAGALLARGDVLIFIDNDVTVSHGFVRAHLAALQSNPGSWIAGRVTHPEGVRATPFGRYRDAVWEKFHGSMPSDRASCTEGGSAANLSLPTADFHRLNGFDESFTVASSEDWDLGIRARRSGVRVLYHPGITVLHDDWALTLPEFCERQRLYSLSDVVLWRKYGDDTPRALVVRQNRPIRWGRDSPHLVLKKGIKRLLATPGGTRLVHTACRLIERAFPDSRLNRRAYEVAVALAMFRGVRAGLRSFGAESHRTASEPATGPV